MPRFIIESIKVIDDNMEAYGAEPVSIDEIKEDLQLSGTDHDKTLTRLRKVARQALENHYNVSIVPKTLRVVMLIPTVAHLAPVPLSPVASIEQVRFKELCGCGDWKTLTQGESNDYYMVDDQHLKVNQHGYYEITYTTDALNNETMLYGVIRQAGYLFSNRDTVSGMSLNPMLFASSTAISPLVETMCSQFSRARF